VVFKVNGNYGDTTRLHLEEVSLYANATEHPLAETTDGFVTVRLKPVQVKITTSVAVKTTVEVDGKTYKAPHTAYWEPGSSHEIGVASPQIFENDTRFIFSGWSDQGEQTHQVAPTAPTTDTTFVAALTTKHRVRVESKYGTPVGAGWYNENTEVTLQVDSLVKGVAGTRHLFTKWVGTGTGAYNGRNNPAKFILRAPVIETATWQTQFEFQVKTAPFGVIELGGGGWYDSSKVAVTDTAPAQIGKGEAVKKFQHWLLDGKKVNGNPISVKMDTSHLAIAVYRGNIEVKIMTSIDHNSRVIVDNDTLMAPATFYWTQSSQHTIDVPDYQLEQQGRRFAFGAWSDGGQKRHTIAPKSDTTFMAELTPQFLLTVTTNPPGVTKVPAGGWYTSKDSIKLGPVPNEVTFNNTRMSFLYWKVNRDLHYKNTIVFQINEPQTATACYLADLFIQGIIVVNNVPVPGVKVLLNGAQTDSCLSGTAGDFFFDHLKSGQYSLTPVAAGLVFETPQIPVQLSTASIKKLNIPAKDVQKPAVQVLSPNGGEKYRNGQTVRIQWQARDNVKVDSLYITYSTDGGNGWQPLARVNPADSVYEWTIPVVTSEKCLVRIEAVDHSGNRQSDQSDRFFQISEASGIVVPASDKVCSFQLHQNYPNPFNPVTAIGYEMPGAGFATIKIYNLSGQEIVTLLNSWQPAGKHRIQWHASGLPSGIYFCRFQSGNQIAIRRMVLAK